MCMHACMHVYKCCVYAYVSVYVHVYAYVCICMYMYVYVFICTVLYSTVLYCTVCMCVYVYVDVYVYVYIRIYISRDILEYKEVVLCDIYIISWILCEATG